jgi:anti-repressor protein
MSELKIFENPEFGKIRTVVIDNKPWFVGKDMAAALGYEKPTDAVRKHIDAEDRGVSKIETPSGEQQMTIINESGMYALILSSKLPTAKDFKRWVTSEVLPSIRKSGGYIAGQESMTDSELMAKALLVAQRQIEERNALIERMRPKEIFADAVSASKSAILVGDLAKILCQNGVQIGQKRLFEWMRENGYLIKQKGASWNMPTQRSMDAGWFEVKETTITHSDGHISVNKTAKVSGKGQVYFVNKFLRKAEVAENEQ